MNMTQEKKSELLHLLKSKKMFGIEYVQCIRFREEKLHLSQLPNDIESLYDYASNCSLCKLSKSKISFDFDSGNRESEIAVITLNSSYNNEKEFQDFKRILENGLSINMLKKLIIN